MLITKPKLSTKMKGALPVRSSAMLMAILGIVRPPRHFGLAGYG
jgi:hypothetical protein